MDCLQLEFMDHLHAMTILLRLGPDAYVIAPGRLRQDLIDYLSLMLAQYRADGARCPNVEAGDRIPS